MGQAGAQREPSMEEILASIRRIIENNEPVNNDVAAFADEVGEGAAGADAEDIPGFDAHARDAMTPAEQPSETPVSADSVETADAPGSISADPESDAAAPVSLAEVAARARQYPDGPVAQSALQESDAVASEAEAEAESEEFDLDAAAAEDLQQALEADRSAEETSVVAEQPLETEEMPQPAMVSAAVEPAEMSASETDEGVSGGQLVSAQTGEKVAAAFGALDAAIAAEQRRSFDEIAEEMLRPMLTQWLDDNLPILVERLVREEIERVSRGNRR